MSITIRPARVDDIPHMASFTIDAWGGIADAMYKNAIPALSLQEIVEHRFTRWSATSSIENCWIAEQNGSVMGGLQAFPMDLDADGPDDPLLNPDSLDAIAPFERLHVDDSYYISVVAVHPEYRSRGVARQLIETIEPEAASHDFTTMSLHVFAENVNAVRLYENFGYREAARLPVVFHPDLRYGGDLMVMTRTL